MDCAIPHAKLTMRDRILFVSAFYPPCEIGGWEQLVHDINIHLQARGYVTHVLTSDYRADEAPREEGVSRLLELESDLHYYNVGTAFFDRRQREKRNQTRLRNVLAQFRPDTIFIHNLWNLSPTIAATLEQRYPETTLYYMASDWPYTPDVHTAYWQRPARRRLINYVKRCMLPLVTARHASLQMRRVLCVSHAIRNNLIEQAGLAPDQLLVVYNGIDPETFFPEPTRQLDSSLSLLYAGTFAPHKGVHTAIEAMKDVTEAHLTLVGDGHPRYKTQLESLIAQHSLHQQVRFAPRMPREQMPAFLRRFDVLLFPSVWDEPLARMVQEAMASGVVVVGTATGGSAEILIDQETGLVFEPEDSAELARHIRYLQEHPDQRTRLADKALALVRHKFTIERMIDQIENCLDV
jgi:glycosyltransferase involved in cell wall biosynthesis